MQEIYKQIYTTTNSKLFKEFVVRKYRAAKTKSL